MEMIHLNVLTENMIPFFGIVVIEMNIFSILMQLPFLIQQNSSKGLRKLMKSLEKDFTGIKIQEEKRLKLFKKQVWGNMMFGILVLMQH